MNEKEIKEKYDLEEKVIFELKQLQNILAVEKNADLSLEEIIKFLQSAMNFNEFQIFLMSLELEGTKISLNDSLDLYFSSTSYLQILNIYDTMQNFNENNINNIKEEVSKEKKILLENKSE